ncbi:MAG: ABC transporter substrate-binding protein [Propionibacteriaceae bacterium]|nr:ABC transporter substrate-binding protein [Propionibacteriaceae bacterium]
MPRNLSRRAILGSIPAITALSACTALSRSQGSGSGAASTDGPIVFGVSGPQTGPSAEYGEYWKKGFDLALDEINGARGVGGRQVELKWEDSQSDPKQSVPIAQRFVADQTILAELGDFSSGASMAASPTYQQAGLVQFGFTNSNPDFTKGGDHMWSTCLTQEFYQTGSAKWIARQFQKISVVYLESDWGKGAFEIFSRSAAEAGLEIAYKSPILPDSEDYRPVLIRARDAEPQAVVHLGYGPDGARVVRQLREIGFTGQFIGAQNTPQFLESAGEAAEGTLIYENFLIGNQDPAVVGFYQRFEEKYGETPSTFSAYAYDALKVLVQAVERGGASREGIFQALSNGGTWQTVQFGDFTFDSERRPGGVTVLPVVVKDGAYVPVGA